MSLFDDAAAFMKNRPIAEVKSQNREEIIKVLRAEFENATRLEVERALDRLAEQGPMPTEMKDIIKKVRIWLED